MLNKLVTLLKWLIYPGINLHARLRYEHLPRLFSEASGIIQKSVLDAGCGNGMLSYKAYLRGHDVIGVSIKESEIKGCEVLFYECLDIPNKILKFQLCNIYSIDFPSASFDEVICAEVLEHLRRDDEVCRNFWRMLKPGGVLHLCAPNAEHPYNAAFPLDDEEKGGHVRPGYTLESYQELLVPIGFRIVESAGLGGPVRQFFNRLIKETQERFGAWAGLPIFFIALLFLPFENIKKEKAMPFSIYVKAVKI